MSKGKIKYESLWQNKLKASDGIHIYFLNLSFQGYKTMDRGRYKKDVT